MSPLESMIISLRSRIRSLNQSHVSSVRDLQQPKIEYAVYKQQTKHLWSKVLEKCREEIGVGSITSQLREFHECHVIPAENQVSKPNQVFRFETESRLVRYRRDRRSPSANCRPSNEEFDSDRTENGRSISGINFRDLSPDSPRRSKDTGEESSMRWRPVPQLRTEWHAEVPEERLLMRQFKEQRAEDHPLYAAEWKSFWERRQTRHKSRESWDEDFMPDWIKYWNNRMNELDLEEEMKAQETAQLNRKRKSHQEESYVREQHNSESGCNRSRELAGRSSKNSTEKYHMTLDHDDKLDLVNSRPSHAIKQQCNFESSLKPSASNGVGALQNPKRVCHVIPSQMPKDVPFPSGPNFLEVLRMLVALEDSLGSLGPSITSLLAGALSSERREIGSSSKLLNQDPTCVDLLDTSKEKLKGLISAGILDGVKGTAASLAVENVTRLLKQPSVTSHSSTSSDGPVGFNMASLISNLQAVGLLRPLQSTTILPSAIGSPSVVVLKDKDSTPSASNSHNSHVEKDEPFSGEELKTLIVNFRTLTASQKEDLVQHLRRLEESYPEKDVRNSSEPTCSSASTSPLSKKYRQYENGQIINPLAPNRPSLKIRFPFISKKTGLSSTDLDNYGIPLDELDPSRSKVPIDLKRELSRCATISEGCSLSAVNHQPCPTGIDHSDQNKSKLGQSSQHVHQPSARLTDASNSCQTPLAHRDGIQQVQELNQVQLQRLSFYKDQLDPRRNRMLNNGRMHVAQHRPVPEGRSAYYQEPIVIPTSPV